MNHPRIRIIRNLRWLGGVWLGAALWTWGGPALAQDFNVETSAVVQKQVRDTLTPFASQAELDAFLKEYQVASLKDEKQIERYNKKYGSPTAAPLAMSRSGDSITNVQHAGVDEGDIVKLHGDHLVVLSRGRLFSVGLAQNTLKPIDAINAYAPDIDPKGTWYDEMLISGDTIAVVSYSYDRGGTEIGLFNVDSAGKLSYRETYHLRSNDYYSSRNYASRLVGSKLIFYTPSRLSDEDPFQ